jgi:uncharacterized membrane protein YdbT with pleckstrin-like domain
VAYVNDVLGKDELVQHAAKTSLARYWLNFVLGGMFLMGSLPALLVNREAAAFMSGGIVLALVLIGWPFLRRATTELVLTNRRVISKFGVLSRDTVEIGFAKVESIRVKQGLLGRLFNYGDLVITGSGATHAPIPNIKYPLEFRRAFDAATEHWSQEQGRKAA